VMGRYVLTPAIFEALRRTEPGAGGEIQLTDGVKVLLGQEKVVALQYSGDYFDVGTIPGWLKTSIALGRARPEFRTPPARRSTDRAAVYSANARCPVRRRY